MLKLKKIKDILFPLDVRSKAYSISFEIVARGTCTFECIGGNFTVLYHYSVTSLSTGKQLIDQYLRKTFVYTDKNGDVQQFDLRCPDRRGTASSMTGKVVICRGVKYLKVGEDVIFDER